MGLHYGVVLWPMQIYEFFFKIKQFCNKNMCQHFYLTNYKKIMRES